MRDTYAETLRDRLIAECRALLDDTEATAQLSEFDRALVRLLAPVSLSPVDAGNALLQLERAYADGLAELEQAGHRGAGLSVFGFLHRLAYVARVREAERAG